MTQHASAAQNVADQQPIDERLPYEVPQLLDCGLVSELTQSVGGNPGADGGYS